MEHFPKNIGQKVQENIKPKTKEYRDELAGDLKTLRNINPEAARSHSILNKKERDNASKEIQMIRNFEIALKNGEQDIFIENVLNSGDSIYTLQKSLDNLEIFPSKLQEYYLDKEDYYNILKNSEKFENLDFNKIANKLISSGSYGKLDFRVLFDNFEKFPKELEEKVINLALETDDVNYHRALVRNVDKFENLSLIDLYQVFKQKDYLRVLAIEADSFPEQDFDYLYDNIINVESDGLPYIFEESFDLFIEKIDNNKIVNDLISLGKADVLFPILHRLKGFDFEKVAKSYREQVLKNYNDDIDELNNLKSNSNREGDQIVHALKKWNTSHSIEQANFEYKKKFNELIDENIDIYIQESGKESVVAGLTDLNKTDYILKYSNKLR